MRELEVEELDRMLTELSRSERDYRDGATLDWNQDALRRIEVSGRSLLRFPNIFNEAALHGAVDAGSERSASSGARRGALQAAAHGALLWPSDEIELCVRQSSRFCPVPEHIHDYMEMSYVYAGACQQTVNGRAMRLEEGQALLLDAACPHAIAELGEHDVMLSVMLGRGFLKRSYERVFPQDAPLSSFILTVLDEQTSHNRYVLFPAQGSRRARRLFQELLCECCEPTRDASQIVPRLFELLLVELVRVYEEGLSCETGKAGCVSVVPIVRYIEQHVLTATLERTAEHFCLSPNYLSSLLKRHTGHTFMQLVQMQRLGYAERLLRAGRLSVEEVAAAAGYGNISFFYRKFRERYGCTPAAYRDRAAVGATP